MDNRNFQSKKDNALAWFKSFGRLNLISKLKHFLPVTYTLFLTGFFFFPSSKSHNNFFYGAVLFPFLILVIKNKVNLRLISSSRIFLLSILFLVYMFTTLFWSDPFEPSDILKYGRRVFYTLVFMGVTIYLLQVQPNFFHRLLLLLCLTAAFAAIANILNYYTQYTFPDVRLLGYGRLFNPISASSMFGIIAFICVYLFQQQQNVKKKLFYLALLPIPFGYMFLAIGRGPLLAWGIAVVLWLIVAMLRHETADDNSRKKILVVLLIFAVGGLLLLIIYPEYFKSQFLERPTYRLEIWKDILSQARHALGFGHGLGTDASQYITSVRLPDGTPEGIAIQHPHGVYVSTLFYGGITGLLLLMVLLSKAVWLGFTRVPKPNGFLLTCMLMFGAICLVTDGYTLVQHPDPFWLIFWFPMAMLAGSELPGNTLYG